MISLLKKNKHDLSYLCVKYDIKKYHLLVSSIAAKTYLRTAILIYKYIKIQTLIQMAEVEVTVKSAEVEVTVKSAEAVVGEAADTM